MKKFTNAAQGFDFTVEDSWLEKLCIPASGDRDEAIFNKAIEDPEKSGLIVADDSFAAKLDTLKGLVEKAKDLNRAYNSDVRVSVDDESNFVVLFKGQEYDRGRTSREVEGLLDRLEGYLKHREGNAVRVDVLPKKGSALKVAMDLEYFLNTKCSRVISVTDEDDAYLVTYTARSTDF